jgi:SAM-dependent methyltransferase
VLEIGSGGGSNAFYFSKVYAVTLTDLSPQMLAVSAALNPDCEHLVADMRDLDLGGRRFDVVFGHDAVQYLTSAHDLTRMVEAAFRHLNPGGVALFVPDVVRENYAEMVADGVDDGGSDAQDGSGIRLFEWTFDLDPTDDTFQTAYVFVIRHADGRVESTTEIHTFGLFSISTWVARMEAAGFEVEVRLEETDEDRPPRWLFLGRRPAAS